MNQSEEGQLIIYDMDGLLIDSMLYWRQVNHAFFASYNLEYTNVRMANIVPLEKLYKDIELFRDVMWYFAGGVFGGSSSSLIKFADLVKEMCIHIIKTYKTLTWEVIIWYLVYCNNKDLFDPYLCDHNDTIIDNY